MDVAFIAAPCVAAVSSVSDTTAGPPFSPPALRLELGKEDLKSWLGRKMCALKDSSAQQSHERTSLLRIHNEDASAEGPNRQDLEHGLTEVPPRRTLGEYAGRFSTGGKHEI